MISDDSETKSQALRVAAGGYSNVNVAKRREGHLRSILITACREKTGLDLDVGSKIQFLNFPNLFLEHYL